MKTTTIIMIITRAEIPTARPTASPTFDWAAIKQSHTVVTYIHSGLQSNNPT